MTSPSSSDNISLPSTIKILLSTKATLIVAYPPPSHTHTCSFPPTICTHPSSLPQSAHHAVGAAPPPKEAPLCRDSILPR
jgi:hypothetical protein